MLSPFYLYHQLSQLFLCFPRREPHAEADLGRQTVATPLLSEPRGRP